MTTWEEGAEVSVIYAGIGWGRAFIRGDRAVLTGERMFQEICAPPEGFTVPLDDPDAEFVAWDQESEGATAIDWETGTRINPEAWEA